MPSEGALTSLLVLDLAGAEPIVMGLFNDSAEARLRRIRQGADAAG